MLNPREGWAWSSAGRLLRTTDGGLTWTDRTPQGFQPSASDGFFLDAQTAWLPIFLQGAKVFGLLHTTDGGLSWSEYPSGPASGLQFTDPLNGWAKVADVGAGNVYFALSQTKDGGKTWAPIPVQPPAPESGLPAGTVHLCSMCGDSFYYDPRRMVIVYGDMITMRPAGALRMQVSFDLGKNWTSQNLPLPNGSSDALVSPSLPSFFNDRSGLLPVSLVKMNSDGSYAYDRLAFYASDDGGQSWALRSGVLEHVEPYPTMQIATPQDLFVLCGNGLCASHDGARTWHPVTTNLDFTQSSTRTVLALDFVDAQSGWTLIQENDTTRLYGTSNGGEGWSAIAPVLASASPSSVSLDRSIPTPTPIPPPTIAPTATPNVVFDPRANADRIQFAPYGTWVEIQGTLPSSAAHRYVLAALQGQVMSVSLLEGPPFSVTVAGADHEGLSDARQPRPFWRGVLPSSQDYFVTVASQAPGPFTLRVAVNPVGEATQNFGFVDSHSLIALSYSDQFAPTDEKLPFHAKGTPLLALEFIDPSYYSPATNLNQAALLLTSTSDPAVVSTCTQPWAQYGETVSGQRTVNGHSFSRAEAASLEAGTLDNQISYRTLWKNQCIEIIFLLQSTPLGTPPAGGVVAFDRNALLNKFEAVLLTFLAK